MSVTSQLIEFLQGRLFKRGVAGGIDLNAPYNFVKNPGARKFATDVIPERGAREIPLPEQVPVRVSPGQLELPLGGVRRVTPTTMPARSVQMGRPAPEPNFRTPINPAPKPEFTTRGIQLTPDEAALLNSDPGTFRSLQGLAERANQNLGLPAGTVKPDLFLKPDWSERLKAYEGGGAEARAAIQAGARDNLEVPIDVAYRNAAGGVQQMDLGSLLEKAGLAGLGVGTAAGTAALMNAFAPRSQTPMGQPTATPEEGPLTPAVTGIESSVSSSIPFTADQPAFTGMGTSVARTRQSDMIEALANARAAMKLPSMPGAPAEYPNIGQYYEAREAYTNLPSVTKTTAQGLGQQSARYGEKDIQSWAYANPELAYELLENLKGNRAMPSQQMPQARGVEISTPMGTNFTNNALGSAKYSVEQMYGSQGASDINSTVTPQFVETLQPIPPDYSKAISRARLPIGY